MTTKAQQISLDNALVALENQCVIRKCNMRINPGMKPKEPTYQVVLDALALTTCYPVFLITEDLAYHIDNKDSKKQDKMFYLRFMKIIIHHFLTKDKSILMSNKTFMHIARDDSLLGAENPRAKKTQKKSNLAISYEETSSKKNHTKAKKDEPLTKKPTTKPKPTKKKALVKAHRGKSLNVLSEVALSEAAQLKEQQRKISGTDKGTGANPSREKEDDEDDTEDNEGNNDGNDSDGNDDDNDNDGDDDDDNDGNDDDDNDGNDDDDSDHERTKSDSDENPNVNQSNEEHE
ncbi:hypothetical protein Tco_0825397 [Tanacetum coccineum]